MGALFALIRQLGMVALIMACATAGTVGLLKFIQKFFGGGRDK